jgi:hypothetical protein
MNRNLLVFVLSLLAVVASEAQNAPPTSINMIAWLAGIPKSSLSKHRFAFQKQAVLRKQNGLLAEN